VPRVHIVNGREDEALLAEVFSNEGIGTLIYANEYKQIRPTRKKDIRAIQQLTRKAVEAEELIRRTRAEMERNLGDYYIFEIDRNPVACVALHVYAEQQQGELAILYVDPSHENQGIGRELVRFVEDQEALLLPGQSVRDAPARTEQILQPVAACEGVPIRPANKAAQDLIADCRSLDPPATNIF
jgi:amino-acid N-acetyltransferase